ARTNIADRPRLGEITRVSAFLCAARECHDEGMTAIAGRCGLRNKKCRHEEWMLGQREDPRLSLRVRANDMKPCVVQPGFVSGVEAEIAVVLLLGTRRAVDRGDP